MFRVSDATQAPRRCLPLLASWPVHLAVRFGLLPLAACSIVWVVFPDMWRSGPVARLGVFALVALVLNSRLAYAATAVLGAAAGLALPRRAAAPDPEGSERDGDDNGSPGNPGSV